MLKIGYRIIHIGFSKSHMQLKVFMVIPGMMTYNTLLAGSVLSSNIKYRSNKNPNLIELCKTSSALRLIATGYSTG